jgi:hypothetical protein
MMADNSHRMKARLEMAEAVVMALVVLGTAWCAYQATLWNGIQTFRIADANEKARLALGERLLADQQMTLDGNIMLHFVDALVEKKANVAAFYLKRARPELRAVLQSWQDSRPLENADAPDHPAATREYQTLRAKDIEASQKLSQESEQMMDEANAANRTGSKYTMHTVLFATVLCFVSLAAKFEVPNIRIGLITVACLMLLTTGAILLRMPLARE